MSAAGSSDLRLKSAPPPSIVRRSFFIAGVAVVAGVLLATRRLDAFTNPQFYAEDGANWYADAYNHGAWQAFTISYAGYYVTLPRIAALIAAPFGAATTPLIYNVFGLAVQVAPVVFFATRRFAHLVPWWWARLLIGAVYLFMPSTELHVTVTNALWHLAVLGALVVLAPPADTWGWRAFDVAVVALCALSGPFAFLLVPIAVIRWLVARNRWTLMLLAVLAVGALVQLYALTHTTRVHHSVGASLRDFVLILCDRIVLAGLFGEEGHTHVFVNGLPHATLIAALICVAAFAVTLYCALRAPWELRLFALFAFAIAAAGLALPFGSPEGTAWPAFALTRAGERYFFLAQLAWVVIVIWAASRLPWRWFRGSAWTLTGAAFASGVVTAWTYPAFVDDGWPAAAQRISAAPRGTHVVIQIPPGPPWTVDITKR